LLRSLIYQERELGNQPEPDGTYAFDLPIDVIARASQLNHRTVEQVIKGMRQAGLLAKSKSSDASTDIVRVIDRRSEGNLQCNRESSLVATRESKVQCREVV